VKTLLFLCLLLILTVALVLRISYKKVSLDNDRIVADILKEEAGTLYASGKVKNLDVKYDSPKGNVLGMRMLKNGESVLSCTFNPTDTSCEDRNGVTFAKGDILEIYPIYKSP
jgi:hypothetical protein